MVLRYRATLMQIYVDEEGYVTWTFAASLASCSTQTLLSTWTFAAGDADLDCCFLGIQSWGHTAASRRERPELEDGDRRPNSLLAGPQDFHVELSDRIHEIKREHLWLKEKDCSWHRPIIATVREVQTKNWRKRSAAGWEHQRQRKAESLAKAKAKKQAKAKSAGKPTPARSWWENTPSRSSWDDSWWWATGTSWTWQSM